MLICRHSNALGRHLRHSECCRDWKLYGKDPNGSTSAKYPNLQQKGLALNGC